jgi:acetylornithine deacetylase/succinyl-diaminopimelate desuccinylase-like protein
MTLSQAPARAYIYSGAWVGDCPRECGNTEFLFDLEQPRNPVSPRTVRKAGFYCSYCHLSADIDWPSELEMQALMAVLQFRPIPHNRNWYPADHKVAVNFRLPHGQSVQDLVEENLAHGVDGITIS